MGTEHTPHASLPRDFTQGEAWDCVLEVWTLFLLVGTVRWVSGGRVQYG